MSDSIISVDNVWRSFGPIAAVQGISFDVMPGQVVGFIGANGAGKTTTMRMIATLDLHDRGGIRICGQDALQSSYAVRKKIGWMPDAYGVYEYMTVFEYLDFFARAYGLTGSEREERVKSVMEFTELTSLQNRFADTLSKGMGQRLCLGRTLLNDPEILILDEPAAGLDPKARVEFKHLVRLLAMDGKSLFISSHILSELEDMCDTLLFIDAGKIVHHGSAETLKRGNKNSMIVDIKVCGEAQKLEEWVLVNPGVKLVETIKNGLRLEVESVDAETVAGLLRRLLNDGIQVYDFHHHERRLEDAFIEILNNVDRTGQRKDSENGETDVEEN